MLNNLLIEVLLPRALPNNDLSVSMNDSKGVERVIMAELDNHEGQKRFKVWFNVK